MSYDTLDCYTRTIWVPFPCRHGRCPRPVVAYRLGLRAKGRDDKETSFHTIHWPQETFESSLEKIDEKFANPRYTFVLMTRGLPRATKNRDSNMPALQPKAFRDVGRSWRT